MSDIIWVAVISTLVPTATFCIKVGRDVLASFRRRSEQRITTAGEALTAKEAEISALRNKYENCRDELHAAWRQIGRPEVRS